jgi:hypothetical protein
VDGFAPSKTLNAAVAAAGIRIFNLFFQKFVWFRYSRDAQLNHLFFYLDKNELENNPAVDSAYG